MGETMQDYLERIATKETTPEEKGRIKALYKKEINDNELLYKDISSTIEKIKSISPTTRTISVMSKLEEALQLIHENIKWLEK